MGQLIKKIELDFDFCEHTYGDYPCEAELDVTGDCKCFNTLATCQDTDNYSPETETLTFVSGEINAEANEIPSLVSAKITPSKLSGGTGRDAPLGQRGKLTVRLKDHAWDDSLVDKYFEERSTGDAGTVYDPISQGTFWPKFRARNRFYIGRGFHAFQMVRPVLFRCRE